MNLNGWDYVVAIEQKQLNVGLRKLYRKGRLLRSFSKKIKFFFQEIEVSGDLDVPTITALHDSMKICELHMPMKNVCINGDVIADVFQLDIQAALVCIESRIQNVKGKRYDIYVDFQSDNAVYNVRFDQNSKVQLDPSTMSLLETVVKREFQEMNGQTYKVASFELREDKLKDFIPKLVDFSFVLNQDDPNRSPFLLCCSLDEKGPQVENRLIFEREVLHDNFPATFWFSRDIIYYVLYRVLNEKIKKIKLFEGVELAYTKGAPAITLKNTVTIEDMVAASDGEIQALEVYAEDKAYHMMIKFHINGLAEVKCKIHMKMSTKNNNIQFELTQDEPEATSVLSTAERVLIGMATLGLSEGGIAIVNVIVEDIASDEIEKIINDKLSDLTNIVSALTNIQDNNFGGHLEFVNGQIDEACNIFLDIKGIETN